MSGALVAEPQRHFGSKHVAPDGEAFDKAIEACRKCRMGVFAPLETLRSIEDTLTELHTYVHAYICKYICIIYAHIHMYHTYSVAERNEFLFLDLVLQ